ncbi:phytase [Phlebopus sp. FC_14]|nr:phytase [Phlebopus sp. FC_14]
MAPKDAASLPFFVFQGEPSPPPDACSQNWARLLRCFRAGALLAVGLFVSASYFQYSRWHRCSSPRLIVEDGVGLPKEFQQTWAAYSPYFAAADYDAPPGDCEITQANLLQRHGARYPTAGNTHDMKIALQKLLDATVYTDKAFEFLATFEWDLGEADLLPLGEKEAFDSGSEHYSRYKHLITGDMLPFVRASGSERVIYSAANWTAGFASASGHMYSPEIAVIIPEMHDSNNTLDDYMCPNFDDQEDQAHVWLDVFVPPIADRVNQAVPGAELSNQDIADLMPLCAFETVFHGTTSPFCTIFSLEEFKAHEYYDDLKKFYHTGYGNALGPVQGVGYVNELLARLTGTPVLDRTQTNRTLDSSPITFPLDRTFYADFSHDNEMIAIYAALGLFPQDEYPSTTLPDPVRTWRVSRMTPFSGRLITEKLLCKRGGEHKEYVRMLVNDAVQPLASCGAHGDGLCEIGAFIESQGYARSNGNGDWDKCFS